MTKQEEAILVSAVGWMHAKACFLLDSDVDIRQEEVPKILDEAMEAFKDAERPRYFD